MSKRKLFPFFVVIAAIIVTIGIPKKSFNSNDNSNQSYGVIIGRNVNMVSGTELPHGDPYLQRQNEPSVAVSTRNPMHLLAGANDYRTIDIPYQDVLPGMEENLAQIRDAWVSTLKSFNGGESWISTLLPGYPQDISSEGTESPIYGYDFACDPTVRAGANGLFYYSGIAANRAERGAGVVFLARYIDSNNIENADTIEYIDTNIIDQGNSGQFIDMPYIAVDVPRGSSTVTIKEQEIPLHNVYLTYSVFLGNNENNIRSKIMFTRSTDCGKTWSKPIKVSESQHVLQRPTIVIDPSDLTGNTIYLPFRRFTHGKDPNAIIIVKSYDGGQTFTKPIEVRSFYPFDQGSSNFSFRTNSYPSLTVDHNGIVYLALAQRMGGPEGPARIVIATSEDGLTWNDPFYVENYHAAEEVKGHQFMPSLTYAGGRLMLAWYDQRHDIAQDYIGDDAFSAYIEDSLCRHTIDVRVAYATSGLSPSFSPSRQVSRYLYVLDVDEYGEPIEDEYGNWIIAQAEFNPPNFPLFQLGTTPFHGDWMEIVPSPYILPSSNGQWIFNTDPFHPTTSFMVWTDNRDVNPPGGSWWGDWQNYPEWPLYSAPYSEQEPGWEPPACEYELNTGMRNQNVYTSHITDGLIVGSPGNTKQLDFPRTFVVFAKNTTVQERNFLLALTELGGANASFEQGGDDNDLEVTIAPYSSVSVTVFVAAYGGAKSTVRVDVYEIDENGDINPEGLYGYVLLNPDPSNPNVEDPDPDNPNYLGPEYHNPRVQAPRVWAYDLGNVNELNPRVQAPRVQAFDPVNTGLINPRVWAEDPLNPRVQAPRVWAPRVQAPRVQAFNILNEDIINPRVQAPRVQATSLTDVTWPIMNEGNTTSAYNFNFRSMFPEDFDEGKLIAQLLIYKVHTSPVSDGCELKQVHHDELVANIYNPRVQAPRVQAGAPSNATSQSEGDWEIPEPTVYLEPGQIGYVTVRVWDDDTTDGIVFEPDTITIEMPAQAPNTGETEPEIGFPPGYEPGEIPVPTPKIWRSPESISFTAQVNPNIPTLRIKNIAEGTVLNYNVTTDAPWLTVLPGSGTSSCLVSPCGETNIHTVLFNLSELSAGTYTANIAIYDPSYEASNNPQFVHVTLYVPSTANPTQAKLTGPTWVLAGNTSKAFTLTTVDSDGNPANVVGSPVEFDLSSTSGGTATFYADAGGTTPITSVTFDVGTSNAIFYYQDTAVGDYTITATSSQLESATHPISIIAGTIDHIELNPDSNNIYAGETQTYMVEAFDEYDNSRGFVTGFCTFSISAEAGGSWAANAYTSEIAGTWTVTATHTLSGETDTATLYVDPGETAMIRVETEYDGSGEVVPEQSVPAGTTITAYAVARDEFGNYVDNVEADNWTLENLQGGVVYTDLYNSLSYADFTGHLLGSCQIRAIVNGYPSVDSGTLTVIPGPLNQINLSPATSTITAGETQTYTVEGFDAYTNSLGDVTTNCTFSINSGAGGSWDENVYTSMSVGTWTVEATHTETSTKGTAALTVNPAPASYFRVTGNSEVTAGTEKELTITAYDQYNNVATGYSGSKDLIFSGPGIAPDGTPPTVEDVYIGNSVPVIFTAGVSNPGAATLVAYKAETVSVDVKDATDGTINSFADSAYDYDLTVVPAEFATDESSVSNVAPSPAPAGSTVTVEVTTYDQFQNLRTVGGDSVYISVEGSNTNYFNPGDVSFSNGIYSISYTPTAIGTDYISANINDHDTQRDADGTSDGIYHLTVIHGPAAKLVFTQNPNGGIGSAAWTTQPVVEVRDEFENTVISDNSTEVTLSLHDNPGSGTLSGTTALTVTNGVAEFSGLHIDKGGFNYTLEASSSGLTPDISEPFNIEGFSNTSNTLSSIRSSHTATSLYTDKVLITGGWTGSTSLSSAELYDPATNTFTSIGPMNTGRSGHSATVLLDNKILIAGGGTSNAELFDPATNSFSATGSMNYYRENHRATLLQDGRVLITGTQVSSGNTAEIYDPISGTFSTTGNMNTNRHLHTSTRLADGKVLITGGLSDESGSSLNSAELYDPATETFTSIGNMAGGVRWDHQATLLDDGTVLITGGPEPTSHNTAEIYEPTTGTFTSIGTMNYGHQHHQAVLLRDENVLIMGDFSNGFGAEIYDPVSQTFRDTGHMADGHRDGAAAVLSNGFILITGGYGSGGISNIAEVWNPLEPFPTIVIKGTITSGGFGVPGVLIDGLPGYPLTNYGGYYEALVLSGWTGTATPIKPGYTFNPISTPYTDVTTEQTTNYTAALNTYSLDLHISPSDPAGGSITKVPEQELYEHGTSVQLTANPSLGYTFDHWAGYPITGSTNPEETIVMTRDIQVTAVFVPDQYTLNVGTQGLGSVNIFPDWSTYEYGTNVTLTANPDPDWNFNHWEGHLSGNNNPETILMDANKSVTAVFTQAIIEFAPIEYIMEESSTFGLEVWLSPAVDVDVSVNYAVTGGTATRGEEYILDDGIATITAGNTRTQIPVQLIDDGPNEDDNPTIQITLSDPMNATLGTLTWQWITIVENNFTITASAGSGGTISPSGDVIVSRGEDQMFTITVNPNYYIKDVVVDGESVGAVATYTFYNVSRPHTISATFVRELQITTSSLIYGVRNQSYNATLTATGGTTPYSWSISDGSLPSGLSLNSSTGVISGEPSVSPATYVFTVRIDDSGSGFLQQYDTKTLTITVYNPLQITTTSPLPEAQVKVYYSHTLTATGGTGTYTWEWYTTSIPSGQRLPPGLSLNPSTGVISGYPTENVLCRFYIRVRDNASPEQTYSTMFMLGISAIPEESLKTNPRSLPEENINSQ